MKKIIYVFVLTLTLIACGKKHKNETTNNEMGVQFVLDGTETPGQYQAVIFWPSKYEKVSVESSGVKVLNSSLEHRFFTRLKHDSDYDFKVESTGQVIGEFKGRTDKDVVVEKVWELNQDVNLTAARIFLMENSQIITNGFNLRIRAKELIAKKSEIMTFKSNAKAGASINGRSGGNVDIRLQKAVGNLVVNIRGEWGGDGIDGKPYDTRAKDWILYYAPAGSGPCYTGNYPDNKGDNGAAGRDGTNSGKGGNSGNLVFEVVEPSEIQLHINQEAGLSGAPGRGGEGQDGGWGGPHKISHTCSNYSKGYDGQKGPHGRDGIKAADGILEKKCVSIGQGSGKC